MMHEIGYGIAQGRPTEETVNALALCAYNFVVGQLKVPSSSIIISGRSIGTGPACYLASELTKIERPPAALVLHSPHSSIRDLSLDLIGSASFFFLNRWENWRLLRRISSPVLFLHADKDQIIDYQHSVQLHAMRQSLELPSELFTQQSTINMTKDHNNFDYENDVLEPLYKFLQQLTPAPKKIELPSVAVTLAEQTPLEYQRYEIRKDSLESNCLWCLCPLTFTTEACLALCAVTATTLGTFSGGLRRDYKYTTRMERGLPQFPIELHKPTKSTKKDTTTEAVNPMAPIDDTVTEDEEVEVITLEKKRKNMHHDNPLVQDQIEDFK